MTQVTYLPWAYYQAVHFSACIPALFALGEPAIQEVLVQEQLSFRLPEQDHTKVLSLGLIRQTQDQVEKKYDHIGNVNAQSIDRDSR